VEFHVRIPEWRSGSKPRSASIFTFLFLLITIFKGILLPVLHILHQSISRKTMQLAPSGGGRVWNRQFSKGMISWVQESPFEDIAFREWKNRFLTRYTSAIFNFQLL